MATPVKKRPPIELTQGQRVSVPLEIIDFDPDQPRKDFDPEWLKELGADIKDNGLDNAIKLRKHPKNPGRFMLYDGENRVRASIVAGLTHIDAEPYTKKKGKDGDLLLYIGQIKTSTNRKALNDIELAGAIEHVMVSYGKTQKQVEDLFKKHHVANLSRSTISNLVLLNRLPDWMKERIRSGHLDKSHGKYIVPAMVSNQVIDALKIHFEAAEKDYQPACEIYNHWCSTHSCSSTQSCHTVQTLTTKKNAKPAKRKKNWPTPPATKPPSVSINTALPSIRVNGIRNRKRKSNKGCQPHLPATKAQPDLLSSNLMMKATLTPNR